MADQNNKEHTIQDVKLTVFANVGKFILTVQHSHFFKDSTEVADILDGIAMKLRQDKYESYLIKDQEAQKKKKELELN